MKLSPYQKKTVRHQFDSLCRKVLRDESRNYKKQLARRAEKEDTEIAEKLEVVGSTIHRRRTSSLEELKLRLEVLEDGQSEE